ncbi:MAG: ComEA family DNA-binding protein [Gemmatimonadales bacterium]
MRESRTILALLALAAAGHGLRLACATGAAPGELGLARQLPETIALAQHRARSAAAGRPLARGERIDLNTASAEEIARLPRVGMSLAKRILEDRQKRGPYRDLRDLDRVPGVGPALLATLRDLARFSGVFSPGNDASFRTYGGYTAGGQGAALAAVDLNSASEKELLALPGVGPARARAILAYRREAGSFAAVSDLERVPGISRSLAARLAPLVTVR